MATFERIIEAIYTNHFAAMAGLLPGITPVHKFGLNPEVGATSEAIWTTGGPYNWLSSPAYLEVVSDSTEDAVGGTGASGVMLESIEWPSCNSVTIALTLNGTTAVSTESVGAQQSIRCNRGWITRVNSYGGSLAGRVTIRVAGGGTVVATIDPPFNQTEQCVYSVPAGHSFVLLRTSGSTDANSSDAQVYQRQDYDHIPSSGEDMRPFRIVNRWVDATSGAEEYLTGRVFPPKTDLMVTANRTSGGQGTSNANANMFGWLLQDGVWDRHLPDL